MRETLIVIPFLASGAQGNEIEYCIEGWYRHFKEPFRIAIIGDFPEALRRYHDFDFIPCPRIPSPDDPDMYHPHLDLVNKFTQAANAYRAKYDGFIFSCDDYYAVNDFGLGEVLTPKINGWEIVGDANHPNGFKRDKARTAAVLRENGYPTMNWTTHLPVYFEFDKLLEIFRRFDMRRRSLVIEDMYFNIYQGTRKPFLLDVLADPFKLGIYTSEPDPAMIRMAFRDKVWITNNPTGWVPALKDALEEYYFGDGTPE